MDQSSEDAWDEKVRSVEKRQIQTSLLAHEFQYFPIIINQSMKHI
jgi:hypothetical protein